MPVNITKLSMSWNSADSYYTKENIANIHTGKTDKMHIKTVFTGGLRGASFLTALCVYNNRWESQRIYYK